VDTGLGYERPTEPATRDFIEVDVTLRVHHTFGCAVDGVEHVVPAPVKVVPSERQGGEPL
jgi:hypothetical protein